MVGLQLYIFQVMDVFCYDLGTNYANLQVMDVFCYDLGTKYTNLKQKSHATTMDSFRHSTAHVRCNFDIHSAKGMNKCPQLPQLMSM